MLDLAVIGQKGAGVQGRPREGVPEGGNSPRVRWRGSWWRFWPGEAGRCGEVDHGGKDSGELSKRGLERVMLHGEGSNGGGMSVRG